MAKKKSLEKPWGDFTLDWSVIKLRQDDEDEYEEDNENTQGTASKFLHDIVCECCRNAPAVRDSFCEKCAELIYEQ